MLYTVLDNFIETGTYEGTPGSDQRGDFILFPIELQGIITAGVLLKTPDTTIQIKEDDYEKENGIISKLKVYY
ncbi:hypothetical protein KQI42_15845 [Tissierella sp. MSJ-40]|uniref:Uncharacterized protein n=1 Tax=Tissierella simiarum TaxID=2841534 RepID=A0ABS6E981_9FIRM|nr:hypothetical protein [Tissierella simiarum]MBU5439488.1 hypothetical protein [Tissierella simiarum]